MEAQEDSAAGQREAQEDSVAGQREARKILWLVKERHRQFLRPAVKVQKACGGQVTGNIDCHVIGV